MRTLLLAVLILAACDGTSAPPSAPKQATLAPSVYVGNLVVRLNALPDRPAAAYFTLKGSESGLRLVRVASPSASRVELHETVTQGETSRMVPLDPATLDLASAVTFAPGGKHAMLFDVQSLRPGQDAALLFTFRRASGDTFQIPATGTIQAAGDAIEHMGH